MDNGSIMFKSAINGFDRKAVISYIFEMNERNQYAEGVLSDQLAEANKLRDTLEQQYVAEKEKNKKLEADRDLLKNELAGERERVAELAQQIEVLTAEVDRQKELIAQKDEETISTIRASAEIKEKLRELEEKRDEVDRASSQIGRLLIDAKADADRMAQEAEASASQILSDARQQADEIIAAAQANADASDAQARERAKEIVSQADEAVIEAGIKFDTFRQEMISVQCTILDAVSTMQDKALSIDTALDALSGKIAAPQEFSTTENEYGEDQESIDDLALMDGTGAQQHNGFLPEHDEDADDFFRFAAKN